MLALVWKLSRGHRLAPWKSPYLRWRLETYWGVPAERIDFRQFFSILWTGRREVLRYLRWANRMRFRLGG